MAESRALTQAEIDALLNQMPDSSGNQSGSDGGGTTGGGNSLDRPFARVIKAYDFRRPDKFSKEQWHTLQSMHDTFARHIGAAFSARLRTLVSVRLSSIEQGLYEEWQAQVPGQTVCYVLAMSPLDGNLALEFSTDLAADIIDRLLGGTGLLVRRDRDLGEIELALLRGFGSAISSTLEDMWSAITPVQVELKDLGLDAGLIQVAGPNDVVVTALFEVSIGGQLGAMSICLPYTVVEPIASALSTQIWHHIGGRARRDASTRIAIELLLRKAPVELVAEVGTADIPVSTILEMAEGDTLVLDRRAGQLLPLLIDGEPRFWARPGLVGKQLALSIVEAAELPFGVLAPPQAGAVSQSPQPASAVVPAAVVPALNEYEEAASA